jgi:hypothetical protein
MRLMALDVGRGFVTQGEEPQGVLRLALRFYALDIGRIRPLISIDGFYFMTDILLCP